MKKLKTKLLYSIILILISSLILNINMKHTSKYKTNETNIYGTIIDCQSKSDKTTLAIKGKEKIIITYYDKYKCKLGIKIQAEGHIETPNNNTIFHLFNYKKYLLSKKIHYIFKATKIKKKETKISLKYKIKNKLINHINTYKSKKYLKTFILGEKKDIEENIIESYKNNGTIHLLAISGMQITIISSIILKLLNKIISKKLSYIITIYILIFYLFITNFSPSILRAAIQFILLSINKLFKLKIKKIHLLIIILLILLNINPYYIYNLGFTLSFIVTLYLIIFNKIINKNKNYILKTLNISIIAFMASSPIIINNYFELNLITPIINLIFIPIVTLIIYPLSLLTVIIKPFDILFYKITNIMERISLTIEKIDIFKITLPHLNLNILILYYIIITIILWIWKEKNKNYIYLFIIIIIIQSNINNFKSFITAIDVGQGDSILLKKREVNILIDTGGNISNNNIVNKYIIPYLKSEGINKLNYLIITHGDYDHIGEAINLVNNFKVEKVIFNCGPYNDLEKELIKVLDKKKIKYYSCIKELNIDKNKLYFLQTKEYDNENDNSNVIYTELNGYKFMFMGDAGVTTEKEILSKYNLPDIDVLKVGHHGSRTSSGKEFINEINPKYSIISVGKNNRYGHPNKEVLNTLDKTKIYRTDQDGSIMFKIKNNKLKVETCSP